jgi:peptidyl-prolyl cis-trans isomerase B (cyclophilin B)
LAVKGVSRTSVVARALRDPQASVRVAAVDAAWRQQVAKVPGAGVFSSTLLAMLHHESEQIVRARAATALSGWRAERSAPAIAARLAAAYAAEPDPTVRWHEAWTLRRAFARETPARAVPAGLRDPEELVRVQFADLVARRTDPSGPALLRPLLRDPSWRVREQAAESLAVLAGGKRTDHLKAIPVSAVTPSPEPQNTEPALPRRTGLGAIRKPVAGDARLDLPLRPSTAALMDGPMPGPHPRVRIGTTQGTIVVRLYPEWAPLTVANFLGLAERGYYDGLRWYRVVPDFVVQTGGHLTGKPDNDVQSAGYTVPAEENPLEQRAGVISMGLDYTAGKDAHAIRDSANVEFYLTISPQLHLDRDFTVFGEIESGFSTLGRLTEADHMTKVERLADR